MKKKSQNKLPDLKEVEPPNPLDFPVDTGLEAATGASGISEPEVVVETVVVKADPNAVFVVKVKGPDNAEIEANIAWLKENKPKIRRYSIFRDDNWAKVDADIEVLEQRMDEEAVLELFGEEALGDDFDSEVLGSALDTCRWLSGEEEQSPMEGWKELVRK